MEFNQAIAALDALAQESRLRVFRCLVARGTQGLSAGEIAAEMDIPANTLSFHLGQLAHAGLIESRRQGRYLFYRVRIEGMRDLMAFLSRDCCQGRPELCGLASEPGAEAACACAESPAP